MRVPKKPWECHMECGWREPTASGGEQEEAPLFLSVTVTNFTESLGATEITKSNQPTEWNPSSVPLESSVSLRWQVPRALIFFFLFSLLLTPRHCPGKLTVTLHAASKFSSDTGYRRASPSKTGLPSPLLVRTNPLIFKIRNNELQFLELVSSKCQGKTFAGYECDLWMKSGG